MQHSLEQLNSDTAGPLAKQLCSAPWQSTLPCSGLLPSVPVCSGLLHSAPVRSLVSAQLGKQFWVERERMLPQPEGN